MHALSTASTGQEVHRMEARGVREAGWQQATRERAGVSSSVLVDAVLKAREVSGGAGTRGHADQGRALKYIKLALHSASPCSRFKPQE